MRNYLINHQKIVEMLAGIVISILLLMYYDHRKIDPENLALGKDTFSVSESWNGSKFTAYSPSLIQNLVNGLASNPQSGKKYWLWLGNSQLHAINQLKSGDHLAPYWARKQLDCDNCPIPLGISVPNSNLQEYLLLSQFIESRIKIHGIIAELPFIGLREDDIRSELGPLVDGKVKDSLASSAAGRNVLNSVSVSRKEDGGSSEKGFQLRMEDGLEGILDDHFRLWRQRNLLKATFIVDLYFFKNWVFNIHPDTVRKIIHPRYERNMRALEDMLQRSEAQHIKVILYIAPIRKDMKLPYDPGEYDSWKMQVKALADRYGAKYLDLDDLVPAKYWGTYLKDNIDFMHFQGPGHKLMGYYMANILNH